MGYAVELYFDRHTEQQVLDLRHTLIDRNAASALSSLAGRPHISLAVFQDADLDRLSVVTQEFAGSIEPFDLQLSAVGIFPSDENVLFLAPVVTAQLLAHHRHFHDQLNEVGLTSWPYYTPDRWMPHCTVEMNIPTDRFSAAVEICQENFKPVAGKFREIGIVEFRPLKSVATWPLGHRSG